MRPAVIRADERREIATPERCCILELAGAAADPNLSVARARVSPGTVTEWHQLSGVDERYLVVRGAGRAEVAGLAPTPVGPGDLVLIPRDTPQRIANTGRDDLVFYCLCTPAFRPECYVARHDLDRD
ncbi:MAG: cupin domain-containing protein [Phycisphaerae bacterium]|nr:cupin domain-containing protein [Phycisphaerae bacterium]MCZ2399368.1 cupin domain-containing protein [Phycisphaerae bacterium]NUQ49275.1 cupin domain-containing protein [Phycisphaerae bacterium]